jgi:hypothetical protein
MSEMEDTIHNEKFHGMEGTLEKEKNTWKKQEQDEQKIKDACYKAKTIKEWILAGGRQDWHPKFVYEAKKESGLSWGKFIQANS